MQESHCPKCADYEAQVMARTPGQPLAPDAAPCESYAMSNRFRDWAVAQMQRELSGQVSAAGLDRMALLKRPSSQPADGKEEQ